MIVRELITRLGFSLNQSQLNNAENGVRRVKDRAEQAATALRNMAAAVASLASVRSIINIADEMQSLRSRIGMLPQTISDAGTAFDEVADRAIAARSSIQAYGQLYVRLAGATSDFINSQEEVLLITDAISQALVIGGANAAEAASATLQLSQAFQKGKLDGDEFRSFMENLSSDFKDKLAKELDTTKDKFFEMSSSGELTTRKLAEAFKRMAHEISKQMLTIPLTVGQATTIVVSRFSRMIDRMNRESKLVTRIADTMLSAFDKIESGVDRVVKSFDGWNNLLRLIGTVAGVAIGSKLIMAMKGVSAAVLLPFAKIIAIVGGLALIIEDLYVWVNGEGDSFTGALIGPWEEWSAYVLGAYQMVKDAIVTIGELVGAFGAILMGALTLDLGLFKAGWQGATDIIYNTLATWYGYFTDTISKIANYISDKLGGFFGGIGASVLSSAQGLSGSIMQAVPAIGPSSMRQGGNGVGMVNNTNVTVTVPPGTPQEQASFLERAAKQSFAESNKPLRAIDMGAHSQ